MESEPVRKTSKDIPPKKNSEIPLSAVKFQRTWSFWESYAAKAEKLDYEKANQLIYKWDDIISFYQFWNKYQGNNFMNVFFDGSNLKFFFQEKYRIVAMNIFEDGIKPLWEDEKNKDGKYLQLEYKIQKDEMNVFSKPANFQWKKLILNTMGEGLPGAKYINGIRFIDKTDFERGRIIMFRIEVWINKEMPKDKLNELVEYLKKTMGCELIHVKDIKA